MQIKDTFLLTAGDTYTAGSTGGEAEHVLTTNEMPSHKHYGVYYTGVNTKPLSLNPGTTYSDGYYIEWTKGAADAGRLESDYTGGSAAHNNMPPYRVVYAWERTA